MQKPTLRAGAPLRPRAEFAGLADFWAFAEGSGYVRSSIRGTICPLNNGAAWVPGGVAVDGTNDFVRIPDNPAVQVTGDFTMEVIGIPTAGSPAQRNWFIKGNDELGIGGGGWGATMGELTSGDIGFQIVGDDGVTAPEIGLGFPPTAGRRYHLIAVRAGSTIAIYAYVYADSSGGARLYAASGAGYTGAIRHNSDSAFGSYIGSGGGLFSLMQGRIEMGAIWHRALTEPEVRKRVERPYAPVASVHTHRLRGDATVAAGGQPPRTMHQMRLRRAA